MDDLLDLDFSAPPATSSSKPAPKPFPATSSVQNSFRSNSPSLYNATSQRPTANYAAFSNLNAPSPTISNVPSRSGTPNAFNSNSAGNLPRSSTPQQSTGGANKEDSFAKLFGKNGGSGVAGDLSKLSLGERQRILNEEKAKISGSASAITEDDLLAAFSADAPVNAATRFPPPKSNSVSSTRQESMSSTSQVRSTARNLQTSMKTPALETEMPADDDDPFGLGMGPSRPAVRAERPVPAKQSNGRQHEDEDEDVLGLLGQPISEVRAKSITKTESPRRRRSIDEEPSDAVLGVTPRDRMVAEIVEMGFPLQKASEALDAVGEESGVQGAISYLLNAAHAEARKETHPQLNTRRSASREHDLRRAQADARAKDPSQRAQELGKSFLSTANSLWKTGAKNLKKAVADFQEAQNQTSNLNGDSDLPKWMRNTGHESNGRPHAQAEREDRTDEAMMLEAREERVRPTRRTEQTRPDPEDLFSRSSRRTQETLFDQDESIRRDTGRSSTSQTSAPSQSRTRELQEASRNEGTSAYVSPARRKKPAAVSDPKPKEPEEDIFAPAPSKPISSATQPKLTVISQPRPKPTMPSRPIPTVSQHALKTSQKHRFAGTASFKLGNYSAATESYSSSLISLPSTHPLYIVILTNRALTHLKTGDPKSSITDADSAISQIGPSKGLNETIDLEDENGTIAKKDMYEYWGKAMMRRAEALEQLEKWDEAALVWKQCVEGNVGGAVSAKGRERCERAMASHRNPTPSTNGNTARPAQTQRPVQQIQAKKSTVPRTSAATQAASNAKSREAVTKLRAANDAANAAEDEKFALSDAVSGRVEAWRKGKEGNLRALLASLDNVLWEGSGWKKVGMGELIMPNKVKIVYMKGIGKCHPDKLSQGATTEQVMIAGSVFSTLNEAWDKFKAENGM